MLRPLLQIVPLVTTPFLKLSAVLEIHIQLRLTFANFHVHSLGDHIALTTNSSVAKLDSETRLSLLDGFVTLKCDTTGKNVL